jgi:hypothetical protein
MQASWETRTPARAKPSSCRSRLITSLTGSCAQLIAQRRRARPGKLCALVMRVPMRSRRLVGRSIVSTDDLQRRRGHTIGACAYGFFAVAWACAMVRAARISSEFASASTMLVHPCRPQAFGTGKNIVGASWHLNSCSSGVNFKLAVRPSAARVAKMRFTLKAVRSKCGALTAPGNDIAISVKASESAIVHCPKTKKAGHEAPL